MGDPEEPQDNSRTDTQGVGKAKDRLGAGEAHMAGVGDGGVVGTNPELAAAGPLGAEWARGTHHRGCLRFRACHMRRGGELIANVVAPGGGGGGVKRTPVTI